MDTTRLKEILHRVNISKGPNLATEQLLALALDQAPEGFKFFERTQGWERWNRANMKLDVWMPPPYTASLGSALALAEAVLPGKHWHICAGRARVGEPLYGAAFFDHGENGVTFDEPIGIAEHEHSAVLAIIAAMLRALIEIANRPTQPSNDGGERG